MQFVAAVSVAQDLATARKEVHQILNSRLRAAPDVLFVFLPVRHAAAYVDIVRDFAELYPATSVLGCSVPSLPPGRGSGGASGQLSVLAGVLPNVQRFALRVDDMRTTRMLPDLSALPAEPSMSWVLFADPRSVDTEALLRGWHARSGGATLVGALAGDQAAPEQTSLWLGKDVYRTGAVALGFAGDLALRPLLLSGCRPLGDPLIVLEATDNLITHFDRGPAGSVVRQLVESLPDADRQQLSQGLCLGMQPTAGAGLLGSRDFVMRSLLSVNSKGVAVVDTPQRLQVVQFHLRDDAHYRRLREAASSGGTPSEGALSFASAGLPPDSSSELAGTREVIAVLSHGEIAPLGGQARLQGLTSVLARFTQLG